MTLLETLDPGTEWEARKALLRGPSLAPLVPALTRFTETRGRA